MARGIGSAVRIRTVSFDYLRAFIVLLVVIHHSVLAYVVGLPKQPATFQTTAVPLVDPLRWIGFDVLVGFNETYFMALMFLLSGLFVWPALERKGVLKFLRNRMLRLGVPCAVVTAILVPLAYYPAYAVTGADPSFSAFVNAWLSLGYWSSGPAWFIWMLLIFDVIAAGFYALGRRWSAQPPGIHGRPAAFAAALLVVSALAYVSMAWVFGEDRWIGISPFWFQASRLLLYGAYFGAGIRIGARDLDSGFLARNAGPSRQWPVWLAVGLAVFALRLAVIITLVQPAAAAHRPLPLASHLLYDLTYVLCCGAFSFAFIGIFRRFATQRHPVLDSLSANAYGMYLVQTPIVVWLQFGLLTFASGPVAKGIICAAGAIILSWAIVAALRRVPAIARVL